MKPFILLSMTLACLAQGVTSWAGDAGKWAFEPLREVAVPAGEGHPLMDSSGALGQGRPGSKRNGHSRSAGRRLHFNLTACLRAGGDPVVRAKPTGGHIPVGGRTAGLPMYGNAGRFIR